MHGCFSVCLSTKYQATSLRAEVRLAGGPQRWRMRLARLVALDRLHQQSNVSSMNSTPSTSSSGRVLHGGVTVMTIIQGYFEGISGTVIQSRSLRGNFSAKFSEATLKALRTILSSSQKAWCRDTAALTANLHSSDTRSV